MADFKLGICDIIEHRVGKQYVQLGFPAGEVVKNLQPKHDAKNTGSIPGLGRSPGGEEIGNPLHYSYLENLMDRGAWQATYSPWGSKELEIFQL